MYEKELITKMLRLDNKEIKITKKIYDKLKISIIDTLGVSLLGKKNLLYIKFYDFYNKNPQNSLFSTSFIWGSKRKVSAIDATFLNTFAGHIEDFDNILYPTFGHPSVMLNPAMFSLYEYKESDGKRFLDALLIGIESMSYFGILFGEGLRNKKLHPTPIIGSLGVIASLGNYLDFSLEEYISGFNLVGTSFSGFQSSFGSELKSFQVASSASTALKAALYTHEGIYNSINYRFIDNLDLLSNSKGEKDELIHMLTHSNSWILEDEDFLYKKFPCCGYFQHVMEGVYGVYNNSGNSISAIKKISLILPEYIGEANKFELPANTEEAKFSLKFNLALYLIYEDNYLGNFNYLSLKDEKVLNLMNQIDIEYKKNDLCVLENDIFGYVELHYYNDNVQIKNISLAKETNYSIESMIEEKFYHCASNILNYKEIQNILYLVKDFENTNSEDWKKIQNDIFKK
ncbi:MmgE/PrpD family protein [Lysinibacillus xylanilyticus]|uniref:MmgE/PrpD family protein n=1 Tax=Lysinibacillus xylanilyticus TaxID=582475 RepID=UPI003CFFCDCA